MIDLIMNGMSKRDANAVIKAVDSLVKLGQIEQPNWIMMSDKTGMEVDSQWARVEKQNRKMVKQKKFMLNNETGQWEQHRF
tara:strand:- start:4906 stop:5148 length:243 start_codon:yes stop_codon:yes gene_type:complete